MNTRKEFLRLFNEQQQAAVLEGIADTIWQQIKLTTKMAVGARDPMSVRDNSLHFTVGRGNKLMITYGYGTDDYKVGLYKRGSLQPSKEVDSVYADNLNDVVYRLVNESIAEASFQQAPEYPFAQKRYEYSTYSDDRLRAASDAARAAVQTALLNAQPTGWYRADLQTISDEAMRRHKPLNRPINWESVQEDQQMMHDRKTGEPISAFGRNLDASGRDIRQHVDFSKTGDYGADPLGDGTFRMVPSGDVVDWNERNRRLRK